MKPRIIGALLVLAVLAAGPAAASTSYLVCADGSGDLPNLAAAIAHAISGDVIELADGVFTGDGNRDLDFGGKALTLRSQNGDPTRCIIDAEARSGFYHRIISFRSGEGLSSILAGLTLRNGFLGDDGEETRGGAILFDHASARIVDCIFEACRAEVGGAVYCLGASPVLSACILRDNSASYYGGAVACDGQSALILEDCRIEDNSADFGAGIASLRSLLTLEGCIIAGNSATERGAGIYGGDNTVLDLSASSLVQNSAPEGAGLSLVLHTTLNCERSVFAFGVGGEAIESAYSSVATLGCSDIYGHSGGNWTGPLAGQLGQAGNINLDPLFCDLSGGNFGLNGASPCSPAESGCGLMGALPVDCGADGRALPGSLSLVKQLYR